MCENKGVRLIILSFTLFFCEFRLLSKVEEA